MENDARARITVFSDYVCPFCYLEKPDLARVREEYGEAAEVDWRALRAEDRTHTTPLEAAEYACGEGGFDEMHEALFRAFFEDGKDIGDTEVLLEVWGSAGLDREGIRAALEEGRYAEKVLADEELARSSAWVPYRRCSSVPSASRSRKPRQSSAPSPTADVSKPP